MTEEQTSKHVDDLVGRLAALIDELADKKRSALDTDEILMTCPEAAQYIYGSSSNKHQLRVKRLFDAGKLQGREEGEGQNVYRYIRLSSARAYRDGDDN